MTSKFIVCCLILIGKSFSTACNKDLCDHVATNILEAYANKDAVTRQLESQQGIDYYNQILSQIGQFKSYCGCNKEDAPRFTRQLYNEEKYLREIADSIESAFSQKKLFDFAKRDNSKKAFREYLDRYPHGVNKVKAEQAIESLSYLDTKSKFGKFKLKQKGDSCEITLDRNKGETYSLITYGPCNVDEPSRIGIEKKVADVNLPLLSECGEEVYLFSTPTAGGGNAVDGSDFWLVTITDSAAWTTKDLASATEAETINSVKDATGCHTELTFQSVDNEREGFSIFRERAIRKAVTNKASFDCGKASNRVEKIICSDVELSDIDYALGTLFSATLVKYDSKIGQWKKEQQDWATKRNKTCSDKKCIKKSLINRMYQLWSLIGTPDLWNFEERMFRIKLQMEGCNEDSLRDSYLDCLTLRLQESHVGPVILSMYMDKDKNKLLVLCTAKTSISVIPTILEAALNDIRYHQKQVDVAEYLRDPNHTSLIVGSFSGTSLVSGKLEGHGWQAGIIKAGSIALLMMDILKEKCSGGVGRCLMDDNDIYEYKEF